LYAFAKYIEQSGDTQFLRFNKRKIERSVIYLKSLLNKRLKNKQDNKYLFFTLNSIHEFPPYETGLEIWANSVCYGALKALKKIGISIKGISLKKLKSSIEKYFWNNKYFIKTNYI